MGAFFHTTLFIDCIVITAFIRIIFFGNIHFFSHIQLLPLFYLSNFHHHFFHGYFFGVFLCDKFCHFLFYLFLDAGIYDRLYRYKNHPFQRFCISLGVFCYTIQEYHIHFFCYKLLLLFPVKLVPVLAETILMIVTHFNVKHLEYSSLTKVT